MEKSDARRDDAPKSADFCERVPQRSPGPMRRPVPLSEITAPSPTVALVLTAGPLASAYSSRANATYVKRTVRIADDSAPRATLTLWNALASSASDLKTGDVVLISSCARERRRNGQRGHRARSFVVASDGAMRRIAAAEDALGPRGTSVAAWCTKLGTSARFASAWFGFPLDARATIDRVVRVVAHAKRCHRRLLRDAADVADAARRESYGAGATYCEIERVGERETAHVVGRVVKASAAKSSWKPTVGYEGEPFSRLVVWLVQVAGGRAIEVHLPPSRSATLDEEAIVGECVDVRNARVRPVGPLGAYDLVCDARFSTWRKLDGDDPRAIDLEVRAPRGYAFDYRMTFRELSSAMRSFGFRRRDAALITTQARVAWVWISTPVRRTRRKVPPMLCHESDIASTDAMIFFGCLRCRRELKADHNEVYAACACSTTEIPRYGFMWRDLVLGLKSTDEDDDVVLVRARDGVAERLLLHVSAGQIVPNNGDASCDDDNDSDDTNYTYVHNAYKRVVMCALNALAAGARNAPMTFQLRFPTLDDNGLPQRNELELVDFRF